MGLVAGGPAKGLEQEDVHEGQLLSEQNATEVEKEKDGTESGKSSQGKTVGVMERKVHLEEDNRSVRPERKSEQRTELTEITEAGLEENAEKEQTPELIAHWYIGDFPKETVDEKDSKQIAKWEEFLDEGNISQIEVGAKLLQCMEMVEDELEGSDRDNEEQMELYEEVIEKITNARSLEVQAPGRKKQQKTEPRGSVLVERQKKKQQ
jgi:hypothetical protein